MNANVSIVEAFLVGLEQHLWLWHQSVVLSNARVALKLCFVVQLKPCIGSESVSFGF